MGFNSRPDRCSRSNRAGHGPNEPRRAPNRVHARVIRRFNKYEFVAPDPSRVYFYILYSTIITLKKIKLLIDLN